MNIPSAYDSALDSIIADLRKGVSPWRKPWSIIGPGPSNFATGKTYSGGNWVFLSMLGAKHTDSRYATLKQIAELGGKVKKGEHGYPVLYWSKFIPKEVKENTPEDEEPTPRFFMRFSTVFNIAQTEGLPESITAKPKSQPKEFSPLFEAERIIELGNIDCPITHGGNTASYSPSADRISMPAKLAFDRSESYYCTLFHECVHATGHKSRLDRNLTGRFGDDAYAKEELIAEIGAAFVCSKAGIDNTKTLQSAAYLKSWAMNFSSKKEEIIKAIVSASSKAQKAADYITNEEAASTKSIAA